MENIKFHSSDFVCKFIDMNKLDFHTLSLKNVNFDRKMKFLVDFLGSVNTKIEKLIIEDCDIG